VLGYFARIQKQNTKGAIWHEGMEVAPNDILLRMFMGDVGTHIPRQQRAVPLGLLYLLRYMGEGDGMTNMKRAPKVRAYIEEVVSSCKPGTILLTEELAAALCRRLHHGESMRDVGRSLRERTDVRLVRTGTWVKL
jgi:hypothetical protein